MTRDPELEAFLALLAARRAPRTVEAYRRDLERLGAFLGGPISAATADQLDRYTAELRAEGLSRRDAGAEDARPRARSFDTSSSWARAPTTRRRRSSLPRRTRKLPRTLSPGEAERLIDAAAGTTPRALRDRALVELLYGAGLRISEATGLEKGGVDLDDRAVRVTGKGGKERVVPIGREAVEALRRYLSRGRPYLDRRHRPELFLNAKGGRADPLGCVPDPAPARRDRRARKGARASPPAPALVRHAPARGRRRPAQRAGDAGPRRPRARPSSTRTSPTGGGERPTSRPTRTRARRN